MKKFSIILQLFAGATLFACADQNLEPVQELYTLKTVTV